LLLSGAPFLVALAPVRDLFLFAKHKFVAARRHIVFPRHFAATTLLPLRKDSFSPTPSRRRGIRFNKINA
jgi:hypothetical protein